MKHLRYPVLLFAGACAIVTGAALLSAGQQPPPNTPAATAPPPPPMPAILRAYARVTPERLKQPAEADWLMVRRTYDGWGFSPLRQITPDNASRLQPVWSFSTGAINGHEATPLVNNGVMFVATPGNQVIAINARTGALLWRYRNTPDPDVVP